MKQQFASPGLHVTSGQHPAGHGMPAPIKQECTCGGPTTYQAAKRPDVDRVQNFSRASLEPKSSEPLLGRTDTIQVLRRASVGPKSPEPLLAEYRSQQRSDLTRATGEPSAYDPRSASARKKPSEALLVETREPELLANTSSVAPSSPGISTHQETGVEARTVSSGKRSLSTARKPKKD